MSSSKKTVSKLLKDLENCKKELQKLSNKTYKNPLYSSSDKSSVRSHALSSLSTSSVSKKSSTKQKVYDNLVYSPSRDKQQKRPVGRPPMKCEDIKNKTGIKTPALKLKAIEKKCLSRETKKYNPYKCTLVDGKCMTISKTYNNKIFN